MDNPDPKRVLVVEDDRDIASLLALHLRDAGFAPTLSHSGHDALERFTNEQFDVILLDLMLPGVDGLSLCKVVRTQPHYTPILILSAKAGEPERVLGLESGADDYVEKPFSPREVLARVKALLRRFDAAEQAVHERPLEAGALRLEPTGRRATLAGETLELTSREFDLLHYFMRAPGRVYTRKALLDGVWGPGFDGFEHTVNSHINRLRTKLEADPANPQFILTVWGVGYKFNDALAKASSPPKNYV